RHSASLCSAGQSLLLPARWHAARHAGQTGRDSGPGAGEEDVRRPGHPRIRVRSAWPAARHGAVPDRLLALADALAQALFSCTEQTESAKRTAGMAWSGSRRNRIGLLAAPCLGVSRLHELHGAATD